MKTPISNPKITRFKTGLMNLNRPDSDSETYTKATAPMNSVGYGETFPLFCP